MTKVNVKGMFLTADCNFINLQVSTRLPHACVDYNLTNGKVSGVGGITVPILKELGNDD